MRIENVADLFKPKDTLLQQLETRMLHLQDDIASFKMSLKEERDNLKILILNELNTSLRQYKKEINDTSKLFDLYLACNTIFNILSRNVDLHAALMHFFSMREELLCGDSLDYCYTTSLANYLCMQIATKMFAPQDTLNLLLKETTTKDQQNPWVNPYTLSQTLPQKPGDFFRTPTNHIHLYEGVVEQAVEQLKRGYTEIKDIWFGTDSRLPTNNSLAIEDLKILKQRTPTLRTLVEYTEPLSQLASKEKGKLFAIFSRLRNGLKMGDADHEGKSTEASQAAHVAVAEFAAWWNALGNTRDGRQRQKVIESLENGRMKKVLDTILDPTWGKHRQDDIHCIRIKGGMLEELLSEQHVKRELYQIEKKVDFRKTNQELEAYKKKIFEELDANLPQITAYKNLYKEFQGLLPIFCKHPSKEYQQFYDIVKQELKSRELLQKFSYFAKETTNPNPSLTDAPVNRLR